MIDSVSVTSGVPAVRIASTSRDRTIRIWHPESGRCERVLFGHDESLKSVAWKPASSSVLLSGSYDFEARLWNLDRDERSADFSTVLSYHRHGVGAVAWWGEHPVTASWDTSCVVWQPTPAGWRPQRVAMITGSVRQRVATGVG